MDLLEKWLVDRLNKVNRCAEPTFPVPITGNDRYNVPTGFDIQLHNTRTLFQTFSIPMQQALNRYLPNYNAGIQSVFYWNDVVHAERINFYKKLKGEGDDWFTFQDQAAFYRE